MKRARGFTLLELVVACGLTIMLIIAILPVGWQLGKSFTSATEYASDLDHGAAAADRIAALVRASASADASSPAVLVLAGRQGGDLRIFVERGLAIAERRDARGALVGREALGAAGAVAFRCTGGLVFFDVELPRHVPGARPAFLSSCARAGAP
jgi:hypothetical protein